MIKIVIVSYLSLFLCSSIFLNLWHLCACMYTLFREEWFHDIWWYTGALHGTTSLSSVLAEKGLGENNTDRGQGDARG